MNYKTLLQIQIETDFKEYNSPALHEAIKHNYKHFILPTLKTYLAQYPQNTAISQLNLWNETID